MAIQVGLEDLAKESMGCMQYFVTKQQIIAYLKVRGNWVSHVLAAALPRGTRQEKAVHSCFWKAHCPVPGRETCLWPFPPPGSPPTSL